MRIAEKIESIINEAEEASGKVVVSICYGEKVTEHMIVQAEHIGIIDGNLLQISSGYTDCSIKLDDAEFDTYNQAGTEFVDITFDEVWISLGMLS